MRVEPPKILLVEEDATLAEITAFRLELLGYRVERVMSADEVFASVDREVPDSILIDAMISGGIDGLEITRQLSGDERTTNIPVMVLASNADLNDVQRAHSAGAREYLVTPYDPAVLEHKLDGMLAGQA